jgi:hypothetical protein
MDFGLTKPARKQYFGLTNFARFDPVPAALDEGVASDLKTSGHG